MPGTNLMTPVGSRGRGTDSLSHIGEPVGGCAGLTPRSARPDLSTVCTTPRVTCGVATTQPAQTVPLLVFQNVPQRNKTPLCSLTYHLAMTQSAIPRAPQSGPSLEDLLPLQGHARHVPQLDSGVKRPWNWANCVHFLVSSQEEGVLLQQRPDLLCRPGEQTLG